MSKRNKERKEAQRQRQKELREIAVHRRKQKSLSQEAAINVLKKEREIRTLKDAILVAFEDNPDRIGGYGYHHQFLEVRNVKDQVVRQCGAHSPQVDAAKKVLLALDSINSDLLVSPQKAVFRQGITRIASRLSDWIRPLETWNPRTKNRSRQFASLVRHLFAKYPVPIFMDEAWLHTSDFIYPTASSASQHIEWWLHIASGQNIRTAKGLYIPLTKKMAHHFLEAPNDFTIRGAFRWGQVYGLGGNERIARGLSGTFLMENFSNGDFWESVIRFFIANPMLDTRHYGPICDYLRDQRFVIPLGAMAPAQPNLCMKNRTADALLNQVETWHARLHRQTQRRKKASSWPHHPGIDDFIWEEVKKEGTTRFQIVQLLTANDLFEEGRRLEHCVGSYTWSCQNGQTSIWSVRRLQPTGFEPLGTIELNNQTRAVVQFAAKKNRSPEPKAWFLLNTWCEKNQIGVSRWLKRW